MKIRETYLHRHDCSKNGKEYTRIAPVKAGVYFHVVPYCSETFTELELVEVNKITEAEEVTAEVLVTEDWRTEPQFKFLECGAHNQQLWQCAQAPNLEDRCYLEKIPDSALQDIVRTIARNATADVRRELGEMLGEAKPTKRIEDDNVPTVGVNHHKHAEDEPCSVNCPGNKYRNSGNVEQRYTSRMPTLEELREQRPWEHCNFDPTMQHLCKRHVRHKIGETGLLGQVHA